MVQIELETKSFFFGCFFSCRVFFWGDLSSRYNRKARNGKNNVTVMPSCGKNIFVSRSMFIPDPLWKLCIWPPIKNSAPYILPWGWPWPSFLTICLGGNQQWFRGGCIISVLCSAEMVAINFYWLLFLLNLNSFFIYYTHLYTGF